MFWQQTNAPTVTLGILAALSTLLWAAHAGLVTVPREGCGAA